MDQFLVGQNGMRWRRLRQAGGWERSRMLNLPPAFHTICPTLHPAFALRGMPQIWNSIFTAVGRAARWAERDEGPKRDFKFNLDPTPEELSGYLAGVVRLSLDVETDREYPPRITICGVAKGPDSAVV